MNDELSPDTLRDKGRELAAVTRDHACSTLSTVEETIRSRPWLFVGGALLLGAAIAAVAVPCRRREPERLEVVRDWLRDAYSGVASRLPDRSDVQSAVDSLDLPGRIDGLRKKLHLS